MFRRKMEDNFCDLGKKFLDKILKAQSKKKKTDQWTSLKLTSLALSKSLLKE